MNLQRRKAQSIKQQRRIATIQQITKAQKQYSTKAELRNLKSPGFNNKSHKQQALNPSFKSSIKSSYLTVPLQPPQPLLRIPHPLLKPNRLTQPPRLLKPPPRLPNIPIHLGKFPEVMRSYRASNITFLCSGWRGDFRGHSYGFFGPEPGVGY
jgi:hypothetical protein